jgi:hypothetical protein
MGFDFDGRVNRLKMFTENDGDIYRQQTTSILKNLATKKARGVYDSELAVQAFMYLAETGAKKYAQEFGEPGASWHEIFPTDVRRAAAKGWRDEFETEYNLGNYDQLLPMKYQGKKETVAKTSKTSKKGKTKKALRSLSDIDTFAILNGTIRECIREHDEGDEIVTIDGIASPDPVDGEARVRIHGEVKPVCVSELRIRADQFHDYRR